VDELRRLWERSTPQRGRIFLGLLCALIAAPCEPATQWLAERIVAFLSSARDLPAVDLHRELVFLAFAFPLLAIVKGAATFGARYFMSHSAQGVLTGLRSDLYRTLVERPVGYLTRRPAAEFASRVTTDVQRIELGLTLRVTDLVVYAPASILLTMGLWWTSWRLALIVTVLLPVAGLLVRRWGRKIRGASRMAQEGTASLATIVNETLTGIRIVKAFCAEPRERERFDGVNQSLRRTAMRAYRTLAASGPILDTLAALLVVVLIVITTGEIVSGRMTIASFSGFAVGMSLLYRSVKKVTSGYTELQNTTAAASRCFELLDDEETEPGGRATVEGLERGISFRGVDFAYGETPVLQDFDLELRKGEVVALVGGSGSGKTTAASLLARFWDVTAGSITWDGVDLREISPRSLRSRIALVTQDAFVFDDTVTRNIAYGDAAPDEERVRAAARAAHADDFIRELEHGYETRLAPLGSRLSGGQRQRIAIARALYKDAPVLVLDEATSSLDSHSEALVQEALATLVRGRTVLVIAHRLATVRDADRIVVVAHGRVVEAGTHRELLDLDGVYRQLHRLQSDPV
jgi:subfamily B ATP-binding cassette protein MsbA